MKKIFLLFTCFSLLFLEAQDFKPFIQSPYHDVCLSIFETENKNLVTLETIPPIDYSTATYLNTQDIDNYGFTRIVLYSSTGRFIKSLKLPDTDSTTFWATNLIQLKDNRYAVAGDLYNLNTQRWSLFFAIINSDFNDFDVLKIISTNYDINTNSFTQYYNQDLIFHSNSSFLQYTLNGDLVRSVILNDPNNYEFTRSMFFFNENLYATRHNFNLIAVDKYFLQNEYNNQISDDLYNAYNVNYSLNGKALNNNSYLVNASFKSDSLHSDINNRFPSILKLDTNHQLNPFYTDTNIHVVNNSAVTNTIDFIDSNHIYTVYSNADLEKNFVLYSLKYDGSLNWKKNITLNSDLEKQDFYGSFVGLCATQDKGAIITVPVLDSDGDKDVYYYKVDSNGNAVDLTTGFFAHQAALQLNDFMLYPNPAENYINIKTERKGQYKIDIYNIFGKRINSFSITQNNRLDLKMLPKGTYFYIIKDKNNNVMQKASFLKK